CCRPDSEMDKLIFGKQTQRNTTRGQALRERMEGQRDMQRFRSQAVPEQMFWLSKHSATPALRSPVPTGFEKSKSMPCRYTPGGVSGFRMILPKISSLSAIRSAFLLSRRILIAKRYTMAMTRMTPAKREMN